MYTEMNFRKIKSTQKKILTIVLKNEYIDDPVKVDEDIKCYIQMIKNEKNIGVIVDARNLKGIKHTLVFSKAKKLSEYNDYIAQRVVRIAIQTENEGFKTILNKVNAMVKGSVPTIVVSDNKSAIAYVK